MTVQELAAQAKSAAYILNTLSETHLNTALEAMAEALNAHSGALLTANEQDVLAARVAGMTPAMLDRLTLTAARIQSMAEGIRKVAALPSPRFTGSILRRPNGLSVEKRRVPLGLVGVIYEARPNVTSDVAALCLKAGNACLLRGGKEALNSNQATAAILRDALASSGLPTDAICFIPDISRQSAADMMHLRGTLDLLIPRGGAALIQTVVKESTVPVIETGVGNCHIYVDKFCNTDMATEIIENAKCSRPSVCNAAETLLVHQAVAHEVLSRAAARLAKYNVEFRGCERTAAILGNRVFLAEEEDYAMEFLDYTLAIRVVDSLEDAMAHITKYSTGHSECIVTNNFDRGRRFTDTIDAAAVYVNASTRFTDGEEFGLGAEIGIATGKLHARGPMGLEALTCDKYVIWGQGQTR